MLLEPANLGLRILAYLSLWAVFNVGILLLDWLLHKLLGEDKTDTKK